MLFARRNKSYFSRPGAGLVLVTSLRRQPQQRLLKAFYTTALDEDVPFRRTVQLGCIAHWENRTLSIKVIEIGVLLSLGVPEDRKVYLGYRCRPALISNHRTIAGIMVMVARVLASTRALARVLVLIR